MANFYCFPAFLTHLLVFLKMALIRTKTEFRLKTYFIRVFLKKMSYLQIISLFYNLIINFGNL